MARYGNGMVEQGVGGRPTPCFLPSHTIVHIPRTLRVDLRERVTWHQYHALHGVCHLRGQLTMPPHDPQVPPTPSTAVPAWYTKLRPRAVRPNPKFSIKTEVLGGGGVQWQRQRLRLTAPPPPCTLQLMLFFRLCFRGDY